MILRKEAISKVSKFIVPQRAKRKHEVHNEPAISNNYFVSVVHVSCSLCYLWLLGLPLFCFN